MRRHLCLASAVTIAGFTAFFVAVPGGIRSAEGCSGSSSFWHAPGWSSASWAVDPTGVPTDGAVRILLDATYALGGYLAPDSGQGAVIAVRGPDNALVPGSPNTTEVPPIKHTENSTALDGTTVFTWRPDAPFLPSTTYTLRVEGLLGNPVDLQFTTGPGPFQPPKPVMEAPSLAVSHTFHAGRTVCCLVPMGSDCVNRTACTGETIVPAPRFSAQVDVDEPLAAAKPFVVPELQLSVNGGAYSVAGSNPVDLVGATGTICARVVATNSLTSATASTPSWCASTDTLDLAAFPNCAGMKEVLDKCASLVGQGYSNAHLSDDALAVYAEGCGSAGAGGGSVDSGVDASSTEGAAASQGIASDPQQGGCSAASRGRRSGASGAIAVMLLALIAALRSQKSSRLRAPR
ncbi:MAG: hypothetical protein HY898_18690 [Deltaproteobacteria bacterium]|nr:hypothetical protein [Deltaproteobacteria bacterium]